MAAASERYDDNTWENWKATLDWRDVWLRAVAMAWGDPAFKEYLLKDARGALREYLGYEIPPFLHFKVVEPEALAAPPQGKAWGWQGPKGDWQLPQAELVFPLPPPPAHERQQALALADFSSAGRSYPFSCI